MCACGDPTRTGVDHTTHVCATAGFFNQEDFEHIEAVARKDTDDGTPSDTH